MNFAFLPETVESVAILAGGRQARIRLCLFWALLLTPESSVVPLHHFTHHQQVSALTSALFSTDSKIVVMVKIYEYVALAPDCYPLEIMFSHLYSKKVLQWRCLLSIKQVLKTAKSRLRLQLFS